MKTGDLKSRKVSDGKIRGARSEEPDQRSSTCIEFRVFDVQDTLSWNANSFLS